MFGPIYLEPWIPDSLPEVPVGTYRHRLIVEQPLYRDEHLSKLQEYVRAVHEDAYNHIRKLAGLSLDPFGMDGSKDPTAGYPWKLHLQNLKGYLGEVLAGIFAASSSYGDGKPWVVPAYMFKFHSTAFAQLERWHQTGQEPTRVPGQPGDDCLAFQLGPDGKVRYCLVCEAKCTASHDASLINEALSNLSRGTPKPLSLSMIIDVLSERGDTEALKWIDALRALWLGDLPNDFERFDLILYACGQIPKATKTWIPRDRVHAHYTGLRKLEAVEVHLTEVNSLIERTYQGITHGRPTN